MNKKIIWDDNFFDVLARGYLGKKTSETQIFTITQVDGNLNLTAYFLDGVHNPVTLWHPSFTSVDMVKEHAVMKLYSNRYGGEDAETSALLLQKDNRDDFLPIAIIVGVLVVSTVIFLGTVP